MTRTLFGKAVELRNSIPWASATAVVLLEDERGRKRLRPAVIAAVAVVLVLVGGVVWFGLRHAPKSVEPPPPVVEAVPKDASGAPPASAAPATTPKPAASVKSGGTGDGPRAAAPKPVAKKTGTLVVTAAYRGKPVSGAKVLVDGERKGSTPLTLALAARGYTLTIEKAGFKPVKRRDVLVRPGKKSVLRVDLKK